MYRLVIFLDLGGTVYDPIAAYGPQDILVHARLLSNLFPQDRITENLKDSLAHATSLYPLTPKTLRSTIAAKHRQMQFNNVILRTLGLKSRIDPLQYTKKWHCARLLLAARAVYDDVFPFLLELNSRKIPIIVITNFDGTARDLCHALGLSPFLTYVFDSSIEGVAKPNPLLYQLASMSMPNESNFIMVGDSMKNDIEPTLNLGWTAIRIERYGSTLGDRAKTVSTLTDVLTCAKELGISL